MTEKSRLESIDTGSKLFEKNDVFEKGGEVSSEIKIMLTSENHHSIIMRDVQ
jgi:hypothetical protein